jgi:hypothetical protein
MRNIGEWGKCSRLIIRSFARFDLGVKQSSSSVHSVLLGYPRSVLYLSWLKDIAMKVSLVYYYSSDKDWSHKYSQLDGIRKVLRGVDGTSLEESLRNSIQEEIGTPVRISMSEIWISPDFQHQGFGCYFDGEPPVNGMIMQFIFKSSVEGRQPIYTHGQFRIEFLGSRL